MWNPLTPGYVVAAMGGPTQAAGRSREELTDWDRGQLLSVYSATRHLAAELTAVEGHVRSVRDEIVSALRPQPGEAPAPAPADAAELAALAARLEVTEDPRLLAGLACEALDLLRADASPPAVAVRRAVRTALRRAVELETTALADAIEGAA